MKTGQTPENQATAQPLRSGDLVGLGYRGSDGAMTCFLCDTEMDWEDCSFCGGDGYFDGYDEDPNWYQPGECVDCSQCAGQGGDYWCPNRECKTMVCTRVVSKPNNEPSERAASGVRSQDRQAPRVH